MIRLHFVEENRLINLSRNLYDEQDKFNNFNNIKKRYVEHMDLLCRTGFYLYEWVDGILKTKP